MIRKYLFGSSVVVLALVAGIFANQSKPVSSELAGSSASACYSYDVENPEEVVGNADYVFAAKVKSADGTIYKNKMWLPQQDGTIKNIGEPYTKYTLQVLSNLKNELDTEKDVSILKMGGIREDGSACDILEGDVLPEVDKTYIFMAYEQEDGSLLVSGANSNIEITDTKQKASSAGRIEDSAVYKTYERAVQNQKK